MKSKKNGPILYYATTAVCVYALVEGAASFQSVSFRSSSLFSVSLDLIFLKPKRKIAESVLFVSRFNKS